MFLWQLFKKRDGRDIRKKIHTVRNVKKYNFTVIFGSKKIWFMRHPS